MLSSVLGLKNQKDAAGHKLMLKMTKPRKPRKGEDPESTYWVEDPESMTRLGEYCRQDVRAEQEAHGLLRALPPQEHLAWRHCNLINARGFHVDTALAEAARKIATAATPEINAEIIAITGGAVETAGQIERMQEWLAGCGVIVKSLDKKVLTKLLEDDELPDDCRQVIELRLGGAQSAAKKVDALLRRSHGDGRIRGAYRYFGGKNGRFSAEGAQPQNMKNSQTADIDAALAAVGTGDYEHVKSLYPRPLAIVGDISRSTICAPPGKKLVGADFSAIECRIISWAAGETWKLQAFAKHDATKADVGRRGR
jgi:DNA polymerase bacteriophage-type